MVIHERVEQGHPGDVDAEAGCYLPARAAGLSCVIQWCCSEAFLVVSEESLNLPFLEEGPMSDFSGDVVRAWEMLTGALGTECHNCAYECLHHIEACNWYVLVALDGLLHSGPCCLGKPSL